MSNTINRAKLLQTLNLVRAALASQPYIPALTHFAFDGETVVAYNDITAISIRCSTELELCLPGDLLLKALNNLSADEVLISKPDSSSVVLASGRSKLKLPSLPLNDFPFNFPNDDCDSFDLTSSLLKGIEVCLISVSNDPTHPAQMGVTIEDDGRIFSTDNFTISQYRSESKSIKLPGEIPIILPTFFCNQLVALGKAFPKELISIEIRSGSLVGRIGDDASIFTKMIDDLEPMDFQRIIKKYCNEKDLGMDEMSIPDIFEGAFERAMLVLSESPNKTTKVTATDGKMKLHSTSPLGDADDVISAKQIKEMDVFHIDPSLVLRASKNCTKVVLLEKVMVLGNDDFSFTHLIAHCSAA